MEKENIILIFVLMFVFMFVYSPHFDYPYPFHIDEWRHIELALKFGTAEDTNIMEIGADFILFIISKFVNIIKIFQFLPALFAVLSAFILFYYLRKHSLIAAFLSIVLLTLLPTNINLLGMWFLTPLTIAMPFFFLSLFIFEESLKEKNNKKLIISLIIAAVSFIIHPPTGLTVILTEFFIGLKEKIFFKEKKNLAYLLILIIPFLLYLKMFWKGSFTKTIIFFSKYIIFTKEFSEYSFSMNPILLYGIIPSILAAIGLIISFKTKKLQTFSFILIISTINLIIFKFFEITFIAHYQRVLYHFMLAAVPLSAVGFISIYEYLKKSIKKKKYLAVLLILGILLTIIPGIQNYYEGRYQTSLYILIKQEEIPALEFIKTLPNEKIITPLRIGNVLYPFTKKEPISSIHFHYDDNSQVKKFYNENCEYKNDLIKKLSIRYVFLENKTNCSFLTNIYQNGAYIYFVNESLIE
jgi:hypothetical protein